MKDIIVFYYIDGFIRIVYDDNWEYYIIQYFKGEGTIVTKTTTDDVIKTLREMHTDVDDMECTYEVYDYTKLARVAW